MTQMCGNRWRRYGVGNGGPFQDLPKPRPTHLGLGDHLAPVPDPLLLRGDSVTLCTSALLTVTTANPGSVQDGGHTGKQ